MVPQITIKRLRIIKRLRKPQPYRRDEEDVSDDMSNEMLERDSRAREEFTFTSDIPPAWLDLEPNNVAHRLGQLVSNFSDSHDIQVRLTFQTLLCTLGL